MCITKHTIHARVSAAIVRVHQIHVDMYIVFGVPIATAHTHRRHQRHIAGLITIELRRFPDFFGAGAGQRDAFRLLITALSIPMLPGDATRTTAVDVFVPGC